MCVLLESLPMSGEPTVNGVTIDYFLWNYAKAHHAEMQDYPIHRTLTVFY